MVCLWLCSVHGQHTWWTIMSMYNRRYIADRGGGVVSYVDLQTSSCSRRSRFESHFGSEAPSYYNKHYYIPFTQAFIYRSEPFRQRRPASCQHTASTMQLSASYTTHAITHSAQSKSWARRSGWQHQDACCPCQTRQTAPSGKRLPEYRSRRRYRSADRRSKSHRHWVHS